MKKTLILIMMILTLSVGVSAELVKLEVPVTLDFMSIDSFNLQWDGGAKLYTWSNTSQHQDESFTMILYQDLNMTDIVCDEEIRRFDNLSQSTTAMLDVCTRLAESNNVTLSTEYADIKYSLATQNEKLSTCKEDLIASNIKAGNYDSLKAKSDRCTTDLQTCITAKDDMKAGNASNPWLFALGGAAIVFAWQYFSKKKDKTSEEVGEGF